MGLRFLYPDGEPIPMKEGMLPSYAGTQLLGAETAHCITPFADIFNQEYNNPYFSLSKTIVNWKQPERFRIQYEYEPGVFTRVVLGEPVNEWLKGAGSLYLRHHEYSIVSGSSWQGAFLSQKPRMQEYVSMHCAWNMINDIVDANPEFFHDINHQVPNLPVRLVGPKNFIETTMKQVLYEIDHLHLGSKRNISELGGLLKLYYKAMIEEWSRFHPAKRNISKKVWDDMQFIRRYIDDNLSDQYTTQQLADLVKCSDRQVKKYFPQITQFTVEEYRKYKLCTRLARKMLEAYDMPFKSFVSESGYSNMPNFTRGFLKHCSCRPTELRQNIWHINGIMNEKMEAI